MYSASVVVPWWDHTDLLSLWENNLHHLQDAEIIFIDNGSSAEGKAALEAFCQRHPVKLLRNEQNRGYAVANNQGARAASGDYILFFNNDIEVLKPPVQYLCELAGDGISGPGPLLTEAHDICVEGWALCIRKSTLEAIGGWCEDYGPGYWDDVDLCHRAVLKGFPLRYSAEFVSDNWKSPTAPERYEAAFIRHLGGTTGDDGRLPKNDLNLRNKALFTQKFYPQLREINLVIFPDWYQSEAQLRLEISQVLREIQRHPDAQSISLLVDSGNFADEDVSLAIAEIVMTCLMEYPSEFVEEPTVAVLEKFHQAYWHPWRRRLHARIELDHEDGHAIAQRAEGLPIYSLEKLHQKRAVLQETGNWELR